MRDPHHVLILVENLSVPFDRRVWHEAVTLRQAGYEVSVICPRGKNHDCEPYAEIEGIRIARYPTPPEAQSLAGYVKEYPYMLAWTLRLAMSLWRHRPFDVIHACNPPDLFFLIGRVFRPLGVSFVYDQHDANPEILLAKRDGVARNGLPERVVAWAERRTYALADVVITPNASYRHLALTRGGKSPEDVFEVRSGPLRDEFPPAKAGEPEYDRRGHRYLIAYVGVMGKQDGVDLLVRAVAERVQRGDDILLSLVGDGESYDEVKRLSESLGIADRVHMPGFQTADEFLPSMRSADAAVAPDPPSAFNEISTMNKIIEYMALEVPCVAFGLRENKVTGGDAVIYAEEPTVASLAEALAQALHGDGAARAARVRLGRRRFEEVLCWEHAAPCLLAAYQRVGEKAAHALRSRRVGVLR